VRLLKINRVTALLGGPQASLADRVAREAQVDGIPLVLPTELPPTPPADKSGRGGRRRPSRTPKGRQVDPQAVADIEALLTDRSRRRDLLIEHLHLIQDKYGHISAAHLAALAAEIRALIVLVIGSAPLNPSVSFGGVTSLTLWGAVTLNTELHRTPLEIGEGLVHEGAHTLLFGYAVDERLVRNPDSERFASPLRSDPRPMDGVFHATFVCARLLLFYRRLLERRPQSLRDLDQRALEKKMAGLAARFDDGARLIADKASLTQLGEKVLRSSVDYVSHDAAA